MAESKTEQMHPVHTWSIPQKNKDVGALEITIHPTDRLFLVGANGSGKSALVQHFVNSLQDKPYRRVSAHRQTWLNSSSIDLSSAQRRDITQNLKARDRRNEARWKDEHAPQRLSALLFDIVASENKRAREVSRFVDNGKINEAKKYSSSVKRPFDRINSLLFAGNLSISIEAASGEEIQARKNGGDPFSIAKLSDGERNAVILAATVITTDPNTIILVDEPERHLHRSIIEPLLVALFDERRDCPFIVSTHELALPVAHWDSRTLITRGCEWDGDVPTNWEVDLLEPTDTVPNDLKYAILGSRNTILFVEGTEASLDKPLYNTLLPDLSIVPKGGCTEVIRAVKGLSECDGLHWVQAYGLIDRDDRDDDKVDALSHEGIFALDVHSAEALYYSECARRAAATRQAETFGDDQERLLDEALEKAITELDGDEIARKMSAKRCQSALRELVLSNSPTWRDILSTGGAININCDYSQLFDSELEYYQKCIRNKELDKIIRRYPVRESNAFNAIARTFSFPNRTKYEECILAMASTSQDFAAQLLGLLGPVARVSGESGSSGSVEGEVSEGTGL